MIENGERYKQFRKKLGVILFTVLCRYHAHQYTNGTLCDLTNQPRETEV